MNPQPAGGYVVRLSRCSSCSSRGADTPPVQLFSFRCPAHEESRESWYKGIVCLFSSLMRRKQQLYDLTLILLLRMTRGPPSVWEIPRLHLILFSFSMHRRVFSPLYRIHGSVRENKATHGCYFITQLCSFNLDKAESAQQTPHANTSV